MLELTRLYYYWPTMRRDCEEYVRRLQICQQFKVQQSAPGGLMGRRYLLAPWKIVAGDIIGPLP